MPNICKRCLATCEQDEYCSACKSTPNVTAIKKIAELERSAFFENNQGKVALFAFSGGKDSVVTLGHLVEECPHYDISLRVFTIETGLKGKKTWRNIYNVIDYWGLNDSFDVIDIRNRVFETKPIIDIVGKPVSAYSFYTYCAQNNLLCCGAPCNSIMNSLYKEQVARWGVPYLLTGGDTLKKDATGHFSIYWKKEDDLTIVRMGAAFGITKSNGSEYIKSHNIPWSDPHCGGYDTDCLLPGFFFRNNANSVRTLSAPIRTQFPIVEAYITERVRWGVMSLNDGMLGLQELDVASDECYNETMDILTHQ